MGTSTSTAVDSGTAVVATAGLAAAVDSGQAAVAPESGLADSGLVVAGAGPVPIATQSDNLFRKE
jgi:hypothetical protein